MSTVPSIQQVVVLPTLKPVLKVKSATSGTFDAREIVVTVDGDAQPAVTFDWASGTNYLEVGPFDRGSVLSIVVRDHETVSNTWKVSTAWTGNCSAITSYEGTIRQAVADVLRAAAITLPDPRGGTERDVHLHLDEFYRPLLVRRKKEHMGPFPMVEVGMALPTGVMRTESVDVTVAQVDVSLMVADAVEDANDAVNLLPMLVNRVLAALQASHHLGLNLFGVVSEKSLSYRFGGLATDANDTDSVVMYEFGIVVEQNRETGAFVPV